MPPDPEGALAAIRRRWQERAPGSVALAERAARLTPSGIHHDLRSRLVPPPYYASAEGAWKRDVDGNRVLDLWMGHGSLLMGHAWPPAVEILRDQAPKSTHLGGCHPAEVELAEAVRRLVPSAEAIRFVMSGTEATLLAIRLARACTGRPVLLKFAEHFHGWHDTASAGRTPPYDVPLGAGLPPGVAESVLVAPPDLAEVERLFSTRDDIAAVIAEPTGAHGGQMPFPDGFVRGLRDLTTRAGALLILDEVVTGFRVDPGGAQALLGVEADLVTYAKILAGGLPGGAVAGRADVMAGLAFRGEAPYDRYHKIPHQGTHNANPLSARVGVAVLDAVEDGAPNRRAAEASTRLMEAANAIFREEALPWRMYGSHSILHLGCACTEQEARAFDAGGNRADPGGATARPQPPERKLFDAALLLSGVDLPPGGQAWTSIAHGAEEVAAFAEALRCAVGILRETGGLA